jgi:hypothetical protein
MLASVENRELDWVCPECGSDECEMTAWVHVNSNEICDGEGPGERHWCPTCEDHPRRLVQRKDFDGAARGTSKLSDYRVFPLSLTMGTQCGSG